VVDGDDWRLTNQELYLQGAALRWSRWIRPRADWDHDHCTFCWTKFMEEPDTDVLHFGYTTTDLSHWICEQCFEDFKNKFHWRAENRV
jgi:phage terminase large subunit-like protein